MGRDQSGLDISRWSAACYCLVWPDSLFSNSLYLYDGYLVEHAGKFYEGRDSVRLRKYISVITPSDWKLMEVVL